MTAIPTTAIPIASSPLRPRPDQTERWTTHREPLHWDEAAQLVLDAANDDGDRDDVVASDLRAWAFGGASTSMAIAPLPLPGRREMSPVPLRELAFSQLCTRIGAPPQYIRALPPKLQTACMNYGLTSSSQAALLRLAGGEIRAVVSDRYAALDDQLVLEVVGDVLEHSGHLADARVRATAVGTHTILRVTVPNEGIAVRPGDTIEYGLDVGNSEVGVRSVQITPVTWRVVCSNGLRAWKSEAAMRMRHIGDPKRLREQLRDAVPVAFAEARGDLARWRRAVDILIDSALDEVESLRSYGLSTGDLHAIGRAVAALPAVSSAETLASALRAASTTAYDVANAITAVAQERGVEARLSMEEVGHRYLSRRAA